MSIHVLCTATLYQQITLLLSHKTVAVLYKYLPLSVPLAFHCIHKTHTNMTIFSKNRLSSVSLLIAYSPTQFSFASSVLCF